MTAEGQAPAAATAARWQVSTAGSLDNMALVKGCEIPSPLPGEVLVKVRAIGLNMADLFAILGLYSATPQGTFTPGLEFAGDVVAVGTGCEIFRIGDRVMGCTRFGAYATHVAVGAAYVRALPAGWSYDEGAGFLCQGLTAWYGLVEIGRLRSYQRPCVLVHSAAGGVGLLATFIVQRMGGKVIATVGTDAKRDFLVARCGLKPEQIIVRSGGGPVFAGQLRRALDFVEAEGLDIVFDSLLGDYFHPAYEATNRRGQIVVFGAASMTPHGTRPNWIKLAWQWLWRPRLDPLQMISENKTVSGFNLIWLWDQIDELTPVFDDMMAAFDWPPPYIGHTFDFHHAKDAVKCIQSGLSTGKVVIQVDPSVQP